MAIKPERASPSKVPLCKCVFIYLFSFRKLGNWKPRAVYNQTSTNIQAVHIQLLTLLGPTYTLWPPQANIMLMIIAQQK